MIRTAAVAGNENLTYTCFWNKFDIGTVWLACYLNLEMMRKMRCEMMVSIEDGILLMAKVGVGDAVS